MKAKAVKRGEVLTETELQSRLRAFKAQRRADFALTRLGYFGSYARGEAGPESDVDIVFDTTSPNLWTTSIMKQDLEEWLNRSVDVVRLHKHLHPIFQARLERGTVYV